MIGPRTVGQGYCTHHCNNIIKPTLGNGIKFLDHGVFWCEIARIRLGSRCDVLSINNVKSIINVMMLIVMLLM
jgi:hypothetical protein